MRRIMWLAGIAAGLAGSAIAQAQQIQDSSLTNFGTGATPPSHILQPPNQQPTNLSTSPVFPAPTNTFNWLGFFKKIKFPTFSLASAQNAPGPVLPGQHP
ncbi:MAG TPA: hypothetical protein VFA18_01670, partial [Gemmataceae bacterium]|nr:hypothetical protein [Gemmataceae bacterium]